MGAAGAPSIFYFALMLAVVIMNTGAQMCFKGGVKGVDLSSIASLARTFILNWPIMAGYGLLFGGSFLYLYVIKHVPVTVAFPTFVLTQILTLVTMYYFFGEEISVNKLIGFALIFGGLYFIWK